MTIIEHAGSNNIAREYFVVVVIFLMIALVHLLEVAQQRLAGNSQPVSLERHPASWRPDFVHGSRS